MRCVNLVISTLLLTVLAACGENEPVATGSKAPGLNRATGTPTPATGSGTTGDATKGQTALTSCTTCHGPGKSAHALNKNDVGSIDAAGSKSYHSSVTKVFTDSGTDIKAYLATQ